MRRDPAVQTAPGPWAARAVAYLFHGRHDVATAVLPGRRGSALASMKA